MGYNRKLVKEIIYVEKNLITEERFLLKIAFNVKQIYNKKATIIMMNPSVASYECSDRTTNKVIREIHKNFKDVGILSILNLFTVCTPKSKELKNKIEYKNSLSWNKNKKIINEECSNSNYIIFAWGDEVVPEHRERENEVLKIIKEIDKQPYCINGLTNKGFPRHPRNGTEIIFNLYKDELQEWLQKRSLFI